MADKKNKMGRLFSKFLKPAQKKQGESLSQPCTVTVYGEGAAPLSKSHERSFRAAAREKWVTFSSEEHPYFLEKNT